MRHVTDEEIADVLQTYDPQAACERLIAMANAGGGSDNTSCVVVEI